MKPVPSTDKDLIITVKQHERQGDSSISWADLVELVITPTDAAAVVFDSNEGERLLFLTDGNRENKLAYEAVQATGIDPQIYQVPRVLISAE